LRTKIGGNFHARFYIKTRNYNPGGVAARADDEIWYDFEGIITSCAVQFTPDNTVQITADFITTGKIELKMDLEPIDLLLQETSDHILLDQEIDGAAAKLGLNSAT